jgi:hypothetical protein
MPAALGRGPTFPPPRPFHFAKLLSTLAYQANRPGAIAVRGHCFNAHGLAEQRADEHLSLSQFYLSHGYAWLDPHQSADGVSKEPYTPVKPSPAIARHKPI